MLVPELFLFSVLGVEPRASYKPGKHSTVDLSPALFSPFILRQGLTTSPRLVLNNRLAMWLRLVADGWDKRAHQPFLPAIIQYCHACGINSKINKGTQGNMSPVGLTRAEEAFGG